MQGTVTTGEEKAAGFIPVVADIIDDELGFEPFPGTFNLDGVGPLDGLPERRIEDPSLGMDNCVGMRLYPCSVGGVRGGVVRPIVEGYPETKTEIVAPVPLREVFDVQNGDRLTIADSADLAAPDGPPVETSGLDEFEAVVFDLDQTLVDLRVDWPAVKQELDALLGAYLTESIHEEMETDLAAVARDHGHWDEFVSLLARYEVEGANRAARLPLLDVLPDLTCPVGICTKNAQDAAETALDRFDVRDAVDVVCARETTREQKPHPEPLERCLSSLDARPGNAVFVGDERTDCETASRAGTSYFHPDRID